MFDEKKYAREYYLKNKDKIIDRVKKYAKDNKEEINLYHRLWREKNRNKAIESPILRVLKKRSTVF